MRRLVQGVALVGVAMMMQACGFEIVDTGYRGVQIRYGAVDGEPLAEGLHFYNPFTSDIKEISVREEKLEGNEACFTRDTQTAAVTYAVTYYPKPARVGVLYQTQGLDWADKIVKPSIPQSIKDVVGQYIADDLVHKREEARTAAFEDLRKTLDARDVVLTSLNFTNLDFDDAYEKAVENKVVAIQRAAESKNKTVEIEEQAKQKVIAAEAEAKSMSIRSQALTQNKGLVEYEMVQKWNGVLPMIVNGGGGSFLQIPQSILDGKK